MIYVMSDLHGCYGKFADMLKKIHFGDSDTLYVLGDVVDRGPDGIRLLLELTESQNIIVLRGNHDHTASQMLRFLTMPADSPAVDELIEIYRMWLSDGGSTTLEAYQKLPGEQKSKVLKFLRSLPIYEEITVNGKRYFLSHTVPEKDKMRNIDGCKMKDFLIGEPEYETMYFADRYIVTGHTPTGFIDEAYAGRIWRKNNHIAVDCGAVFGNPLGCICLDTLEEYYAEGENQLERS